MALISRYPTGSVHS